LQYNDFVKIPESVRALLWEYNLPDGDLGHEWERTVIERVMARGRLADMRWLLRAFERPMLLAFLSTRGRRALAPRELRFWSRICAVPGEVADAWVAEARAKEQAWRG
jgi:hypothetical protein